MEITGGVLFLEHTSEAALQVPLPFGEAVVFSRPSPVKESNEDAAGILPYPGGALFAVADGMGGLAAGERASRITLETLRQRMSTGEEREEALRHAVLDGLELANRAVLDLGIGAGTTFAGVIVRDNSARAVHVGDSLVLHVGSRGKIKARTISHSPTGYAIEAGILDEEAAMHHEERHLISNFVGRDGMRIEFGASVPIAPKDTLLVATDGLSDNLTLEEMVTIVRKGPLLDAGVQLAELAETRMRAAVAGRPSKPDDLTFILFRPCTGAS
ncbi:MAG: PP2C family serine/threonine-protein phosphatase [Planctomycetota bacterium]